MTMKECCEHEYRACGKCCANEFDPMDRVLEVA